MALTKNTIRLKASFYNFTGVLDDPQQITLAISDMTTSASIVNASGSSIVQESTGIYHYDFTIPVGKTTLIYEWSGDLESSPIVNRGTISREWLRD
jgi:hypothetical protein